MAEVEVLDEGPGIPAGTDLFSGAGGRGIGLYVVQRLVQEMGGTVQAERRPSGGSRFVVRLPLAHRGVEVSAGHR